MMLEHTLDASACAQVRDFTMADDDSGMDENTNGLVFGTSWWMILSLSIIRVTMFESNWSLYDRLMLSSYRSRYSMGSVW